MRNDPRYTPSDVFETFPRPPETERLKQQGLRLDRERREIMVRRDLGLTKLYNFVNDPTVGNQTDPDVATMRSLHVDLDLAVLEAYGWGDLTPEHGFHEFRKMVRWTLSSKARAEVLDRLLDENHRRASGQPGGEVAAGSTETDSDDVLFS